MSLIHDALRAVDADTPTTAPAPKPLLSPADPHRLTVGARRTEWWVALGSFAVVVVAGAMAWALWRSTRVPDEPVRVMPQPPAPASTVQPVVPEAPVAASPQVPVAPEVLPQPPVVDATPAVSMPADFNKKVNPSLSINKKVAIKKEESRPASVPNTEDDSMPVEQRFARFMAAMGSEDVPTAQQELSALRKRLPPHAVGLLRAQAWFDLRTRNTEAAVQGYRQVLERLPGDEEAAVNLASLLSQMDRSEQAREVLAQALSIRSDSAVLRNALRRFTPEARP